MTEELGKIILTPYTLSYIYLITIYINKFGIERKER